MKKRFLSILTALCLTLTLLPTAALADEGDAGNIETSTTSDEATPVPKERIKIKDGCLVNGVTAETETGSIVYTVSKGDTSNWNQSSGTGSVDSYTYCGVYITAPEGATSLKMNDEGNWDGLTDVTSEFFNNGEFQHWFPIANYVENEYVLFNGGRVYNVFLEWSGASGVILREYVTVRREINNPAASIGTKTYLTVQDAIDAAANNDVLVLERDTFEAVTVPAGKTITLDLNGKTLANNETPQTTGGSGYQHTIVNYGTLTVTGSGTVDNVSHGKGALVNYGAANLNGGTFTRSAEAGRSPSDNGGNSWYVIDNHGTMTIDGATVTSTGKYSSLIRNIKANENEDGVLNVVSGNLQNGFITLKNDTAGRLNVTGGTITSDDQAIQNWNEATISGGELTGLVYSWSAGANESAEAGTLTISGNAKITGNVYAVQYKYDNIEPTKAATVKIEGGTIIGTVSTATSGYGPVESPTTSASMTVSGGNFSSSVREEFLAEELTAELYSTSKNSQAPYSYYVSVSAALEDAKAGDTVVDLTAQQGTEKYTVTLRYGNGEADTTYTELAAGTTLALPTPTRTDYRFDGWYVNGTRYTNSYPVSGNVTLVAQWTYVGSSSGSSSEPSYSPVMDVSDGGSIKINPRTPEEDDEVTITVDPDSGYEVDEVTVTDRNGREVKVTAERNGTYTFTQPRGRVTISVTFVREGGSTFFSDVPESFWAYDEIAWAYDNGYVNGTSASSFSPNASISRQQVWMILARLSGADPANMSAAREWAVTNGVSDGTTPGGAVTRQQLVALLYRYATLMGYANDQRADLSAYPDAGTVAGYAVEPMQWSVANSIVGGTSNGTLDPTGTATRAQFAVILYRFWDQVG